MWVKKIIIFKWMHQRTGTCCTCPVKFTEQWRARRELTGASALLPRVTDLPRFSSVKTPMLLFKFCLLNIFLHLSTRVCKTCEDNGWVLLFKLRFVQFVYTNKNTWYKNIKKRGEKKKKQRKKPKIFNENLFVSAVEPEKVCIYERRWAKGHKGRD